MTLHTPANTNHPNAADLVGAAPNRWVVKARREPALCLVFPFLAFVSMRKLNPAKCEQKMFKLLLHFHLCLAESDGEFALLKLTELERT